MDSDEAVTVQYENDGRTFEILVKPDEALDYKRGDIDNFERVIFVREIFKDAAAAEKASAEDIKDEFDTKNVLEAAEELFDRGTLELTTEQRNEIREQKRKELINLIARRAMNPQTNSPHPPKRIENAIEEAGVQVEAMEPIENQFEETIEKIRPKLPISLEEKEIAIKIPNEYAGKCYGKIKTMSTVLDEEWGDDGFMARVKLPAGVKKELESELNSVCHGDVEIRDL
ncbi:MAG: ribosome assembly factor SBDS [Candidatus Nanohaloarchaeota archaeon QJJ-5]|nr:ribosome assembly factor SBDS [Candidatus Nanohaloarchaeota archaeon QJJ-5]